MEATSIDRAEHIRRESDRFASVLAETDPAAAVPTCPDWTAVDLLKHLTQVHDFWAAVIGDRLTGEQVGALEENRAALPESVTDLLPLRAAATDALLTALASREPSDEAWSWFPPDQSVDFTWRMQTHEATMHRVDAELTAGSPISRIDAAVAADGIDHVVAVMWAWVPADAERHTTGTLELRATDTGQSWLLDTIRWSGMAWGHTFVDHPACVRSTGGTPTATISGSAHDLDLLVWTRADQGIDRAGDDAVLAQFQAVLDEGIQ